MDIVGKVTRGHWKSNGGQNKKEWKKSTIWVLLESSSFVEFNYWKMVFIKGHWRLLRDTKGQIEF